MSGLAGLFRLAASAVLTGLVVAACAPRPEPEAESDHATPVDPPESEGVRSAEGDVVELRQLKLTMEPVNPTVGQAVEFHLTVQNTSGDELVLDFPNGQRFDFAVSSGGSPRWRWAEDMFFPQMLGRERVASGDQIIWSATVESGFPAGHYNVRGTMTTNVAETIEMDFDVSEGASPS